MFSYKVTKCGLVDNVCVLEEHAALGFWAEQHTSLNMQAEGTP
jgi:hypothetical protein